MENLGEHLVGQYLKEIKGCDFVEYNLQTQSTQGEIDVVGINTTENTVYICEVAIHLETGLQYVKDRQPNNVNKLVDKFKKDIDYANDNFDEYEKVFMLWTPVIKTPVREDVIHNQSRDIQEIISGIEKGKNVTIKAIYNKDFLSAINELRSIAKERTDAMTSPVMRFLQIEEKLIQKNGNS